MRGPWWRGEQAGRLLGKINGERESESVGSVLPETVGEGTPGLRKGVWKPRDGYHGTQG